jgi:hypothetical protein
VAVLFRGIVVSRRIFDPSTLPPPLPRISKEVREGIASRLRSSLEESTSTAQQAVLLVVEEVIVEEGVMVVGAAYLLGRCKPWRPSGVPEPELAVVPG